MTSGRHPRAGGRRPMAVELIGPAGAGKSTVAKALARCHPDVRAGFSLWGLPWRLLAASAPELLGPMLVGARAGKPLHQRELAQVLRMAALRRMVHQPRSDRAVLLLDEGPIFGFTWLEVFFAREADPGWASWRRKAVSRWGALLDAVVWLDAADAVIASRIRARPKPHPIKSLDDPEIYGFTARFRQAFGRVIEDLKAARSLTVYRIRSDRGSAENIALRLRAALRATDGR